MSGEEKINVGLNADQRKKVIEALVECLDDSDNKTKLRAIEKIIMLEKQNQKLEYG